MWHVVKVTPTAIFPQDWKAVNININETPKIMMLKSFFPSEDILCILPKSLASVWKNSSFLLKVSS